MSAGYVAVQWSRHKRIYDACVAGGIVAYLGAFFACGKLLYAAPNAISDEILAMRALGTCAYLLLHVILCIGPLARLDRRFLPILYNRRHLGVATFLVGLCHGGLALGFYHGFGNVNTLYSLLTSNTNYASLSAFPFQVLGLIALVILFLMAATSHDFWLKNLGAPAWKRLHMLVYVAYALLVMHVALGILQTQRSLLLAALVAVGACTVAALHVVAGMRERHLDDRTQSPGQTHSGSEGSARCGTGLRPVFLRFILRQEERPTGGRSHSAGPFEQHRRRNSLAPDHVWESAAGQPWVDVGCVDDIADCRGSTVTVGEGERIAIFRHDGCISATTNVCAHQGGPIGEGKIIDGCITCPWHGWQYRPADGQSPPPFTEKIATYRVRVVDRRIEVDPSPLPPGTPVEPARIEGGDHE